MLECKKPLPYLSNGARAAHLSCQVVLHCGHFALLLLQRGVLSDAFAGPEESVCFPRDVVFVFDRSGSMTGRDRCCSCAIRCLGRAFSALQVVACTLDENVPTAV